MKILIEYTKNGRRMLVTRAVAKVLVKKGLAREVNESGQSAVAEPVAPPAAPKSQTRMLQATTMEFAPYGFKADGTPRKRPAPAAKKPEA